MTFDYKKCKDNTPNTDIYLLVNGVWEKYTGSTSLRKLYYRAYEAQRTNRQSFYVWEFEKASVTGAMFPNEFYNFLRCTSIDGIPSFALPQRIILRKKKCDWKTLGNGCGRVCLYCGDCT